MNGASKHLVLASIHDVSPRFEGEVDHLTDVLRPHVGNRLAMLVVPNHWGDAPVVPGSPFATRLRAWTDAGIEMLLHGFYHYDERRHDGALNRMRARFMTANEGEFLGLDGRAAAGRITEGRALIEDIIGRSIAGFVAPAWLYGKGSLDALADCAIPIAEDHWRVWSPARGEELARGPVITWASRTPLRLSLSLAAAAVLRHAPVPLLRIAVHPPDSRHPGLMASIKATLQSATKNRSTSRYSDLLIL